MGKRIFETIIDVAIIILIVALAVFAENTVLLLIFGVLAIGLAVAYCFSALARVYKSYEKGNH